LTPRAATSAVADRLIGAWDERVTIPPITTEDPAFDVAAGYAVLGEIERRRIAQGWRPLGRKIGFTNRTIWDRYGVHLPMWAHVWDCTVHDAPQARAALSLAPFVQPRIEPEVVFGLCGPIAAGANALEVMSSVAWIAPGFEIVQSHFPDWKFGAPDCTAALGLHGALVVGPRIAVAATDRAVLVRELPAFSLELRCNGAMVDRGVGANVLDSPALALAHLAGVLARQPQFPALAAGELVTTGTVTDAWPVAPGETWTSDYGTLGLPGMTLSFTR
jgi:2-oxo-3-hexenedioate decarboxylase